MKKKILKLIKCFEFFLKEEREQRLRLKEVEKLKAEYTKKLYELQIFALDENLRLIKGEDPDLSPNRILN